MTLVPDPDNLGLDSPALGPWFNPDLTLAAPAAGDLFVLVQPATDVVAFPPATGLLGYHIASDPRPPSLRRLRNAAGDPAFATGGLVALFTLLPEVEQRLFAIAQGIASPATGAAPGGVPTRATVRHLAYEFTADPTMSLLEAIVAPALSETTDATSDADKAAHVGLSVDNGKLANSEHPMTELHVPGQWFGERPPMINIAQQELRLWAFDDNGRALDPGAVASWWNFLATTLFNNLWAPGPQAMQRTASVAAQLTVHLVNPAEGPPDGDVLGRVDTTALGGSGTLLQVRSGRAAALSFTTSTGATDNAPVPLMALLPNGVYGSALTLYNPQAGAGTPVPAGITRDYVRVGVVDVERHLVGQPRSAPDDAPDPADRRAADQNRATTGVRVNQVSAAANLTLHTTIDAAANAVVGLFGTNPTTFVIPTLDREYASLSAANLGGAVAPPTAPPTITARPLVGGNQSDGSLSQTVLLQLQFDDWPGAANGAWVRVWPLGFDVEKGRHVRLDGGAGATIADGRANSATAHVIVALPHQVLALSNDSVDLGCDVSVVTGQAPNQLSTVFADVRFAAPGEADAGASVDANDAAQLVACEMGATGPTVGLRPGSSLFSIEDDDTFALVDPASATFVGSIDTAVAATDTVVVTQPAWVAAPDGDVTADADLAATVARMPRVSLNDPQGTLAAGVPHPTMEFYDTVATSVSTGPALATATIGPASGFRHSHELPPHMFGHPGAPAAREIAGGGVSVNAGPAAVAAEVTRDRANPSTADLATAARTALPTFATSGAGAPPAAAPWVAVLQTIGCGVRGEPGLGAGILGLDAAEPGFDDLANLLNTLSNVVNGLPSSLNFDGDVPRAVSRRLLAAGWGHREVATSLDAAFARAEDFVYVETPAIDALPSGRRATPSTPSRH